MGRKHTAYHIINSDLGYTHSKQQLDKYLKITFATPSKTTDEKEKEKKKITEHLQGILMLHANAKKKVNVTFEHAYNYYN